MSEIAPIVRDDISVWCCQHCTRAPYSKRCHIPPRRTLTIYGHHLNRPVTHPGVGKNEPQSPTSTLNPLRNPPPPPPLSGKESSRKMIPQPPHPRPTNDPPHTHSRNASILNSQPFKCYKGRIVQLSISRLVRSCASAIHPLR